MLFHLACTLTVAIAVYYNIGKILYTVIYLPLTVFVIGKAIGVAAIAAIISFRCWVQSTTPSYSALSAQ